MTFQESLPDALSLGSVLSTQFSVLAFLPLPGARGHATMRLGLHVPIIREE
jgi:hypothetical protein